LSKYDVLSDVYNVLSISVVVFHFEN
jgi:hypothetical protein